MIRPISIEQTARAYEAYAAMQRLACSEPALLENEYFRAAQDGAYARFMVAYNALEVSE
jgi:hypothetical protein